MKNKENTVIKKETHERVVNESESTVMWCVQLLERD